MKKINLPKRTWGVIGISSIVVIIIVAWILKGTYAFAPNLEQDFEKIVIDYYEARIKGKVIGIDKQIITLSALKNANYDIDQFQKAGCNLESYAYVILENAFETDIEKIEYNIENHLDCPK